MKIDENLKINPEDLKIKNNLIFDVKQKNSFFKRVKEFFKFIFCGRCEFNL